MLKDKNDEKIELKHVPDKVEPEGEADAELELKASDSNSAKQPDNLSAMTADLPSYFELLDVLGEGGMGAVFKVRDTRMNKLFAIKMLRPEFVHEEQALHRFSREAQAAKGLTHVNLAAVYDYGVGKHGAPYLVMDYLDGKSLEKIIKEEIGLSVPRAIDLFLQMTEAVGYAHARGVVHRDLKPSNMIIEGNPDGVELVKLVDFGIAKSLLATDSGRTRTGDVIGSPPYMSPEQCEGLKLDARSDIYSLGCVMYETLCGAPPFVGTNSIQTILKHMRDQPVPISKAANQQTVPDDLNYIVMRCLEKNREDRYRNVAELKRDLQLFKLDKKIRRTAAPKPEQKPPRKLTLPRFLTQSPLLVILSSLIAAAMAAALATSLYPLEDPIVKPPPTPIYTKPPWMQFSKDEFVLEYLDTAKNPDKIHGITSKIDWKVNVNARLDGVRVGSIADNYLDDGKYSQAAALYEFSAKARINPDLDSGYKCKAALCYLAAGDKKAAARQFDELFQEIDKNGKHVALSQVWLDPCGWASTYARLLRELDEPKRAADIEKSWSRHEGAVCKIGLDTPGQQSLFRQMTDSYKYQNIPGHDP